MAQAASAVASDRTLSETKASPAKPAAKRSALRRLIDAIEQHNMRRAEQEIARYLGGPGARFTDESEREIERRFLSNPNW